MATKKKNSIEMAEPEKSFLEKIGEKASHIKDEIISGKDHLVEAVENKIAAVKMTIKKYKAKKKIAVKKPAKKAVKKSIKKLAKKVTPVQKSKPGKSTAPKKT
ncbi:MAG: hypothetical protein WDO19_02720 [Bacteroidota bacterium]